MWKFIMWFTVWFVIGPLLADMYYTDTLAVSEWTWWAILIPSIMVYGIIEGLIEESKVLDYWDDMKRREHGKNLKR